MSPGEIQPLCSEKNAPPPEKEFCAFKAQAPAETEVAPSNFSHLGPGVAGGTLSAPEQNSQFASCLFLDVVDGLLEERAELCSHVCLEGVHERSERRCVVDDAALDGRHRRLGNSLFRVLLLLAHDLQTNHGDLLQSFPAS